MASKDQQSIGITESPIDKYNRGLDLFIESVAKPDHALRACAHNQKCYNELMEVRDQITAYCYSLRKSKDVNYNDCDI